MVMLYFKSTVVSCPTPGCSGDRNGHVRRGIQSSRCEVHVWHGGNRRHTLQESMYGNTPLKILKEESIRSRQQQRLVCISVHTDCMVVHCTISPCTCHSFGCLKALVPLQWYCTRYTCEYTITRVSIRTSTGLQGRAVGENVTGIGKPRAKEHASLRSPPWRLQARLHGAILRSWNVCARHGPLLGAASIPASCRRTLAHTGRAPVLLPCRLVCDTCDTLPGCNKAHADRGEQVRALTAC